MSGGFRGRVRVRAAAITAAFGRSVPGGSVQGGSVLSVSMLGVSVLSVVALAVSVLVTGCTGGTARSGPAADQAAARAASASAGSANTTGTADPAAAPAASSPADSAGTVAPADSAGPAPAPFYGLNVPHARLDIVDGLSRRVGFAPSVLSAFIRLDSPNTAAVVQRIAGAGYTPFVTLEPWHAGGTTDRPDPGDSLASIVAGVHDAELRRQAEALASCSGPIWFRFAHEMNASWYPWGVDAGTNTEAEYVAAWRHVHAVFAAVRGLELRWIFAPVALDNPRAHDDLRALYPGDDVVDDLGVTGYSISDVSADTTFAATLTALRSVAHKPIVLAEVGADDGPAKAAWLRSLGPYLLSQPDVMGFVYFDTTVASTGATGDYAITTTADQDAMRSTLTALHARVAPR